MSSSLALLVERDGERVLLRSPEVGYFTHALGPGALLAPGTRAGLLLTLGRRLELRVPEGVLGRVENERPERVLAPVDYGAELYRLAPLESVERGSQGLSKPRSREIALAVRAPYSGRFWQRPAPGEKPFLEVGGVLTEGQTLGLIEVMKTFTQLVYRAEGNLPGRARVVRILVPDGGEVKDGGALIEIEPA